jgi:hypothetical protein
MNYFEKYQLQQAIEAEQCIAQLQAYKDNPEDKTPLRIAHQRLFGGHFYDQYKKESLDFLRGDSLDYLTNQNLSRDTTLLWHTSGEKLRLALRSGQLKPQALTSKAIKALGKYNKKCMDRRIKSRIESVLWERKKELVDIAQDRIEHLQGLERFLGHCIHDAKQSVTELVAVLDVYSSKQQHYLDQYPFKGYPLVAENALIKAYWCKRISADKDATAQLKALLKKKGNDAQWLETTGYDEILSFIRKRTTSALKQTQALNQILTHRRDKGAYLRGDLNSFIEDALKLTRDHAQDLHNPVNCDHQLAYAAGQRVTVDSDHHTDGSIDELEDLVLVVSEISGDNEQLNDKALKEEYRGEITQTTATKWKHFRSFYDSNPYKPALLSSFKYFFGTLWNYLLSPLNFLETMILGNRAYWIGSFYYLPPDRDLTGKTNYYALAAYIKEHTYLSTKIGLLIHKTFSYLLWEGLFKGFYDGFKQLTRLPVALFTDFHRQAATIESVLAELQQELVSIEKEEKEIKKRLPMPPTTAAPLTTIRYAQATIDLVPYNSHGLLKSGADGFTGFIDLFGHNMFAKHPFTAAISSLGAATSFLAFFAAPAAVSLMGKGYVNFLLGQGYIWSKDLLSASLAGSFTHFKLIGAVLEGIEHGPDSWLSKGVNWAVKDPATVITYTTLSWMMGYAIVNLVNIPGLTEELRAHIGNPPALTEIFGGFKVGIIGYHLSTSPHQASEALREEYVNKCVALYKKMQKQKNVVVSAIEENTFRSDIENLVSPEKMEMIQENLSEQFKNMLPAEKNGSFEKSMG